MKLRWNWKWVPFRPWPFPLPTVLNLNTISSQMVHKTEPMLAGAGCRTNNKHITTVTLIFTQSEAKHVMLYTNPTWFFCVFVWGGALGTDSGRQAPLCHCSILPYSPSRHSTSRQVWVTGLWWCTWRLAVLWSAYLDGYWSVPPCPQRSGLGLRWTV